RDVGTLAEGKGGAHEHVGRRAGEGRAAQLAVLLLPLLEVDLRLLIRHGAARDHRGPRLALNLLDWAIGAEGPGRRTWAGPARRLSGREALRLPQRPAGEQ